MDDYIEPAPRAIGSPCINLCRIDRATGWCEGCGRTIDEITRWGTTDDDDRRAILDGLPNRIAALGR